jgi:hypothetical protein
VESAAAAVVLMRQNHQIRAQQQAGMLSLAISRQRPLLLTDAVNEMPWSLHTKIVGVHEFLRHKWMTAHRLRDACAIRRRPDTC